MKRTFVVFAALYALAALPLCAEDDRAADEYAVRQDGAWPTSWPKELDPLRFHHAPSGRFTNTFWRSGEDMVHFGIRFTSRKEFEAAWPHLLKVKSKGAPIVLRRGPSHWLGGASHGVCVHQQPAIWRVNGRHARLDLDGIRSKPLSEEELEKLKITNHIELIVDGTIVDLNRISLPAETPIIDERFKDAAPKSTNAEANRNK